MEHLPKQFGILVAHDTYTDPWLKSMRKLESELECVHCVYVEDEPPAVALPEGFVINRLDASHTQKIIALYRHSMESLANEQYIGECLQDGMYGAFYKGELCGFIGVHEQESIGILEVHPKWRRKGLAVALEQVMIGKQLERGRLPYGEIVKDNTASIRLQKKAGMITDEKLTYWYFP
ncbi:GNAT family N-acetyltransferase [[Clostridium] innocuum]|nr:GNAT family N-acetyltransferase [[Clostridium] innocuum]